MKGSDDQETSRPSKDKPTTARSQAPILVGNVGVQSTSGMSASNRLLRIGEGQGKSTFEEETCDDPIPEVETRDEPSTPTIKTTTASMSRGDSGELVKGQGKSTSEEVNSDDANPEVEIRDEPSAPTLKTTTASMSRGDKRRPGSQDERRPGSQDERRPDTDYSDELDQRIRDVENVLQTLKDALRKQENNVDQDAVKEIPRTWKVQEKEAELEKLRADMAQHREELERARQEKAGCEKQEDIEGKWKGTNHDSGEKVKRCLRITSVNANLMPPGLDQATSWTPSVERARELARFQLRNCTRYDDEDQGTNPEAGIFFAMELYNDEARQAYIQEFEARGFVCIRGPKKGTYQHHSKCLQYPPPEESSEWDNPYPFKDPSKEWKKDIIQINGSQIQMKFKEAGDPLNPRVLQDVGLRCQSDGKVLEVNGEAQARGVQCGWKIIQVNWMRWRETYQSSELPLAARLELTFEQPAKHYKTDSGEAVFVRKSLLVGEQIEAIGSQGQKFDTNWVLLHHQTLAYPQAGIHGQNFLEHHTPKGVIVLRLGLVRQSQLGLVRESEVIEVLDLYCTHLQSCPASSFCGGQGYVGDFCAWLLGEESAIPILQNWQNNWQGLANFDPMEVRQEQYTMIIKHIKLQKRDIRGKPIKHYHQVMGDLNIGNEDLIGLDEPDEIGYRMSVFTPPEEGQQRMSLQHSWAFEFQCLTENLSVTSAQTLAPSWRGLEDKKFPTIGNPRNTSHCHAIWLQGHVVWGHLKCQLDHMLLSKRFPDGDSEVQRGGEGMFVDNFGVFELERHFRDGYRPTQKHQLYSMVTLWAEYLHYESLTDHSGIYTDIGYHQRRNFLREEGACVEAKYKGEWCDATIAKCDRPGSPGYGNIVDARGRFWLQWSDGTGSWQEVYDIRYQSPRDQRFNLGASVEAKNTGKWVGATVAICDKKDSPNCGDFKDQRDRVWLNWEDGTSSWADPDDIRIRQMKEQY